MNAPIHDPTEFLKLFLAAIKEKSAYLAEDRACVITRCPTANGGVGSTVVEWEGTPPHFSIYWPGGRLSLPIFQGKAVKQQRMTQAITIIRRFLAAHPANADETPVWVGTRWRDKP
jgi:hypothetical protein